MSCARELGDGRRVWGTATTTELAAFHVTNIGRGCSVEVPSCELWIKEEFAIEQRHWNRWFGELRDEGTRLETWKKRRREVITWHAARVSKAGESISVKEKQENDHQALKVFEVTTQARTLDQVVSPIFRRQINHSYIMHKSYCHKEHTRKFGTVGMKKYTRRILCRGTRQGTRTLVNYPSHPQTSPNRCSLNSMVSLLVRHPLHAMIGGGHTLLHAMARETMNMYHINTLN